MEPSVAGPPDRAGWQIPAHAVTSLAPRRSRHAVCLFVINEAERLHRQLAKMRGVGHGLDVVIADGGSTDGSTDPDRLAAAGVRGLLVKRGPGRLSAQMRMGLAWCLERGLRGDRGHGRQRQGRSRGAAAVCRGARRRTRPRAGLAVRARRPCGQHAAVAAPRRHARPRAARQPRGGPAVHRHDQRLPRLLEAAAHRSPGGPVPRRVRGLRAPLLSRDPRRPARPRRGGDSGHEGLSRGRRRADQDPRTAGQRPDPRHPARACTGAFDPPPGRRAA